jgi:hypothetical protein
VAAAVAPEAMVGAVAKAVPAAARAAEALAKTFGRTEGVGDLAATSAPAKCKIDFRDFRRPMAPLLTLPSENFGTSHWQLSEKSTPIAGVPEKGLAAGFDGRHHPRHGRRVVPSA